MPLRPLIVLLALFFAAVAVWIVNEQHVDVSDDNTLTVPPEKFVSDLNPANGVQPLPAGPDPIASINIDALPLESLCHRVFDAIYEPAVEFSVSGTELRTASYAALDRIINFADNCLSGTIEIVGHTDSLGDEVVNRYVGQLRAQAVASYLSAGGVPASRLKIASRGSTQPIADNETRSGRAKNRRIELRLMQAPDSR